MKTFTKEMQDSTTPKQALDILKEGNKRFTQKDMAARDLIQQAEETASGQYPFAVVLSCIDSRTAVEQVFDQGIGDVFSARIAGNIVNEDILGSMEFGCKVAGSKIIVVMGHSHCGAVKGACDHVELGNLTGLLNKIQPAIDAEKSVSDNRDASNSEFVAKVTELNVKHAIDEILKSSPLLKEMLDAKEIGIVGAVHDIQTGKVDFLGDCQYL